MQGNGPSWLWAIAFVMTMWQLVRQTRILRGKVDDAGWPFITSGNRAAEVAVLTLWSCTALACLVAFVVSL
jgi:hypothetical protein